VIIGDVNPPQPEFPESENLRFFKVDVSEWESVRSLFVQAQACFNRIDHVFVNAGVGPTTNFLDETLDESGQLAAPNMRTMNINLTGVIYTLRLTVHFFRKEEDTAAAKSIVLAASASSFQNFGAADYGTAKHGVLGVLRGVGGQIDSNIRVNAVAPSWTATGMVPTEAIRSMGVAVQEPEAVARSVVLLFADQQRYGEVIYSWDGKFREINKAKYGLLDSALSVLGGLVTEDEVINRLQAAAETARAAAEAGQS
jgi:NAD(P)-dependent dehydrogenase (short-subunit alcohol dehydrogenase family)